MDKRWIEPDGSILNGCNGDNVWFSFHRVVAKWTTDFAFIHYVHLAVRYFLYFDFGSKTCFFFRSSRSTANSIKTCTVLCLELNYVYLTRLSLSRLYLKSGDIFRRLVVDEMNSLYRRLTLKFFFVNWKNGPIDELRIWNAPAEVDSAWCDVLHFKIVRFHQMRQSVKFNDPGFTESVESSGEYIDSVKGVRDQMLQFSRRNSLFRIGKYNMFSSI